MAARQSRAERRRAAREIARKQVRRPPPIVAAPSSAISGEVSTPMPETKNARTGVRASLVGMVEIRVSWRPCSHCPHVRLSTPWR